MLQIRDKMSNYQGANLIIRIEFNPHLCIIKAKCGLIGETVLASTYFKKNDLA